MSIKGLGVRNFYQKYTFTVEVGGIGSATFQTCSEVKMETADVDHFEGGGLIPDKQPGRVTVSDVTLTRGMTNDLQLYQWFAQTSVAESIKDFSVFKRPVTIYQKNRTGAILRKWLLTNCYPKSWSSGDWDNNADEVRIETVVLRYDFPAPLV